MVYDINDVDLGFRASVGYFLVLGTGLLIDSQPYVSWPRIIISLITVVIGLGLTYQAPVVAFHIYIDDQGVANRDLNLPVHQNIQCDCEHNSRPSHLPESSSRPSRRAARVKHSFRIDSYPKPWLCNIFCPNT